MSLAALLNHHFNLRFRQQDFDQLRKGNGFEKIVSLKKSDVISIEIVELLFCFHAFGDDAD